MSLKPRQGRILSPTLPSGLVVVLSLLWAYSSAILADTNQQGATVKLHQGQTAVNLADQVWYYLDESNTLDINQIQQLPTDQFVPGSEHSPNFGMTSATLWVKLRISNPLATPIEGFIELAYPHLDLIELFRIDSQAAARLIATAGDHFPYAARDLNYRFFVFPITFKGEQDTALYFKVKTQGTMQVPLTLWSSESIAEKINLDSMAMGVYYGILLALILYNVFIYVSVKDQNYLFYIIYLTAFGLGMLWLNGLAIQYLWPDHPKINMYFGPCMLVLSVLAGIYFVMRFLSFDKDYPVLLNVLYVASAGSVALALAGLFVEYRYVIYATLFSGSVVGTMAIAVFYMAIKVRHPSAKYLILAFIALLAGGIVYAAGTVGLISFNVFTQNAFQFGSALEGILLSLALADRINRLKGDVIIAQEKAINHLELYQQSLEEAKRAEEKQRDEEKKRFLAEQNQMMSDEKNRAKSQFFATMSHEFRTPLTSIIGYTELAEHTQLPEADRLAYLKTVKSSAEHMLQLINDILDISKIEAQKLEVEYIDFELKQVLKDVYDLSWMHANQKKIHFSIVPQGPLPKYLNSDPTRLKQVLINLCANAIKFTSKGSVTVAISYNKALNSISFAVKDTGIGIDQEKVDKLFSAFEQAGAATSRNFGGTGLGLYLSKQIANKLKGDISVESSVAQGSTFTLTIAAGDVAGTVSDEKLDLFAREAVQDSSTVREGMSSLTYTARESVGKRVLLAEDNEVNLKLISKILENTGAQVTNVRNGVEAVAHGLLGDFDLILMDMEMPVLDGLQAAKLLKACAIDTPVYALTGNVANDDIARYQSAGFAGHLAKPIDMERLRALVQ